MRSIPIVTVLLVTTLAVSACSRQEAETPDAATASSASSTAAHRDADPARSGPDTIGRHNAPGVAFDYAYHFALPRNAIGPVQEKHVRACEQLGLSRCRVTGMKYDAGDNDRIDASLSLRLAPDIARMFARDAVSAVKKSKGKLVNAAVTGEDAAAKLAETNARIEQIAAHRKVLEAQLGRPGLLRQEREELRRELSGLGEKTVTERLSQSQTVQSVATTPMTFAYASTEGFGLGGSPLNEAAHASWRGTSAIVWMVTVGLGVALPWLVLVLAVVLGWRLAAARRLRAWLTGRPAKLDAPD
ncbi:hypothetical protein [Novosphingobium sp.]|uniref:hypothetical protein n=1 Tax=Novosphingobium sp. TaxID=1874826 RepID=UPI0025D26B38|nr:hypothetical protein [Novosphingobium sp.]